MIRRLHGCTFQEGFQTLMRLRISICAVLAGLLLLPVSTVNAQRSQTADIKPGDVSRQPAQPRPGGQAGPAAEPPVNAAAELAKLSPELRQTLQDWYLSSQKVDKLHGEHCRFIYDYVFNVETRAIGKFYYEAPSRGRIDLTPKPGADGQNKKTHPETGEVATFNVKPETEERWICDGQQVLVIDEPQKTVQQYPIPKESQGVNIMDGPLPFLFGMAPEKAVERYKLRLENPGKIENHFDLLAVPRWRQDAANYKWARIRIERKTMLPMAVQMMDPTGGRETVYTFPKVEKNPKPGLLAGAFFQKIFGTSDPFRPDLKGYDIQVASQVAAQPGAAGPPGRTEAQSPMVPSVVGLDYRDAEKVLKARGYTVKLYRGEPAANAQLKFKVAKQDPPPRITYEPGNLVKITLYTDPVQQAGGTAPQLPSGQSATVRDTGAPNVVGLPWTDAEKMLKDQGLVVKFRRGRAALRESDVFRVYDQSPKEGTAFEKGDTVTLTLFAKPGESESASTK
ncbi:MAG: PASTA domain-containing protein [Planctomycetota bacterium]|nr:PASTA domain-containing protein [Planctomycetota bacterium]